MIRHPLITYSFRAAFLFLLSVASTRSALGGYKQFKPTPAELQVRAVFQSSCLQCHGVLKTAGLDLRSRSTMLAGGSRGKDIVPGSAVTSRIYRVVSGLDKLQMPPARKLDPRQVQAIKSWIDSGAPWIDVTHPQESPYPYNKPIRFVPPNVKNKSWAKNPIDRFILSKLESKGLRPSPPADRITLIRRATFDLTGLPPTPAEIDAFLSDKSDKSYEKLVDRLLASPHYGERWARHWLDLARYAESEGFKSDEMRPNAWRYRDYVIKSLNEDKPYNRFIQEQIAGDELWPDNPDSLVATGFCRHYADESNARNLRLRRQEILNDITDTVGSTILGLTLGCARCHNHKYDPLPQKDYYRLQAYFAAVRAKDDIPLIPPDKRPEYDRRLAEWQTETTGIRTKLAAIEEPVRKKHYQDLYRKFPPDIQQAIDSPAEKRTSLQWILFRKAESQLNATDADIQAGMKPEDKKKWTDLQKELDRFKPQYPGPMPIGIGITDIGPEAPKTHVLAVGVYDNPTIEVQPGPITVCCSQPSTINHQPSTTTGRRSALAAWLTSPDNPLTARVMVNRLWHYHFGRGIVGTPSDFGNTGEKPSHIELLDWLTTEFVRNNWSLKQMHRLMMLSSAYRQCTDFNPKAARIDPENRLLWRFNRQRLEGEAIRDSILAVSGELNPKVGGPSVMPELPSGLTTRGYWKDTPDEKERNRRSVYVFVKRNLRYPLFQAFDMPDTHEPCSRREVTTTAPQALMLMNDETVLRSAQHFAGRIIKEAGVKPEEQVDRAYRLAFGRKPMSEELQRAISFLSKQAALIEHQVDSESPLLLPKPAYNGMSDTAAAALVDFCHTLFNANEFIYVD